MQLLRIYAKIDAISTIWSGPSPCAVMRGASQGGRDGPRVRSLKRLAGPFAGPRAASRSEPARPQYPFLADGRQRRSGASRRSDLLIRIETTVDVLSSQRHG